MGLFQRACSKCWVEFRQWTSTNDCLLHFSSFPVFSGHGTVEKIDLSNNLFQGNLSDSFAGMRLSLLDLSTNNFSGPIPASLGMLSLGPAPSPDEYIKVHLEFNQFEGSVPSEVCRAVLVSADCLEDLLGPTTTAVADNVCEQDCCTMCCNRITQVCSGDFPPEYGSFETPFCDGLQAAFLKRA